MGAGAAFCYDGGGICLDLKLAPRRAELTAVLEDVFCAFGSSHVEHSGLSTYASQNIPSLFCLFVSLFFNFIQLIWSLVLLHQESPPARHQAPLSPTKTEPGSMAGGRRCPAHRQTLEPGVRSFSPPQPHSLLQCSNSLQGIAPNLLGQLSLSAALWKTCSKLLRGRW